MLRFLFVLTLFCAPAAAQSLPPEPVNAQSHLYVATDTDFVVGRFYSVGGTMIDTLPGDHDPGGRLPPNKSFTIKNVSTAQFLYIGVKNDGPQFDLDPWGYTVVAPLASVTIYTDPTSNYLTLDAQRRAKLGPGQILTLYLDPGGQPPNNGVTTGTAFANFSQMRDAIYQRYDFGQQQIIVQAKFPATYGPLYVRGRPPGVGNPDPLTPHAHAFLIQGDITNASSVINNPGGDCVDAINNVTFHITGFTYQCAGAAINASGAGTLVGVGVANYGTLGGYDMAVSAGANVHFDNSPTQSGNAKGFQHVETGGVINNSGAATLNIVGPVTFSDAIVSADSNGTINDRGFSVPSGPVGLGWRASLNGVITDGTINDCNTIFRGTISGAAVSGGRCNN
jgi:hypothetical protein